MIIKFCFFFILTTHYCFIFDQVEKIEDTGIYVLKMLECFAMGIYDLDKISEDKTGNARKKLAADIFTELAR